MSFASVFSDLGLMVSARLSEFSSGEKDVNPTWLPDVQQGAWWSSGSLSVVWVMRFVFHFGACTIPPKERRFCQISTEWRGESLPSHTG